MKKDISKKEKLSLVVEERKVFGKQLRKLRREGKLPGNIFGQDFKSTSITTDRKAFVSVFRVAKETGVVYLNLKKEEIPTLIKNLQRHPVSDDLLHVDFRKIDLKKKIETEVPVTTINTSEAVTQKGGVLLIQSNTLLVEALPSDIPSEIVVDISVLKDVGSDIKVADLKTTGNYVIKTEPEKVVVSITAHKEESITPETTAVATEVIGEKTEEGAATEGEVAEAKSESDDKKPAAPETKPAAKPEAKK